ncbi:hypothetical protein N2152v2_003926 [Parachlorella kessleri]
MSPDLPKLRLPLRQPPTPETSDKVLEVMYDDPSEPRTPTGLFLIPSALTAPQQRRLVVDCLTVFPQSPSHTNYTRQHGLLPATPSLWEAAQRGLHLHHLAGPDTPACASCTGQCCGQGTQQQQQQQYHDEGDSWRWRQQQQCHVRQGQQQQQQSCVPSPGMPHEGDAVVLATGLGASAQGVCAARPQAIPDAASGGCAACAGSSSSSSWAPGNAEGRAPAASKLLRKLRWATLGPPYDWTLRQYCTDVPYRHLPCYLVDIATELAAAVEDLVAVGEGKGSGSSDCCCSLGSRSILEGGGTNGMPGAAIGSLNAAETSPAAAAAAACPVAAPAKAVLGGCSGGGGRERRPFCPDVALINYYHEGDTLGGHVDDAEHDLDQPIVTISLGCEAVFLAGGLTKASKSTGVLLRLPPAGASPQAPSPGLVSSVLRDVPPLALLLRSGDAVVLAGAARRCYHGVPRILTDRPLPPGLAGAGRWRSAEEGQGKGDVRAAGVGAPLADDFAPFADFMCSCRINVSIRAVG